MARVSLKEQNEQVKIKNISKTDFLELDMEGANEEWRGGISQSRLQYVKNRQMTSPKSSGTAFVKPDRPVLMWDGETYGMEAGEVKSFSKPIADHFARKIAQRAILERASENEVTGMRLPEVMAPYLDDIYMRERNSAKEMIPVKKKPEDMNMAELRKVMSEKGLKAPNTAKKDEVLGLIANAD